MATTVTFITTSDSMKDAMSSAGIDPRGTVPACPYSVGDFLTFPQAPGLAFRITKRLHAGGNAGEDGEWLVFIEPAPHPLG